MIVLELLLRIILKLIEILSHKPSDEENADEKEFSTSTKKSSVNRFEQRSTSMSDDSTSRKNVIIYNNEVNSLITQIIATHRKTEEADMNEILRLRKQVSNLQEELVVAKSDLCKLRKVMEEVSDQNYNGKSESG